MKTALLVANGDLPPTLDLALDAPLADVIALPRPGPRFSFSKAILE